MNTIKRLVVALVHPTNYDHNRSGIGSFASTHARGVLPSNTLRVLKSLTSEAVAGENFAHLSTEVYAFEDGIRKEQKSFRRLLKRFPEEGSLLVVGFAGVQSNQFPRAVDLINDARRHNAICVIGGPHITASINANLHGISRIDPMRPGIPCPHQMPDEIQSLIDRPGVIVFHGDADNRGAWAQLLARIVEDNAPSYIEAGLADELMEPGEVYTTAQLDAYATPVASVDTERGCPFKCRFCAAIQAHGRTMRCREPQGIVDWVRRQCEEYRKPLAVLFASDNLARNPHWRELLQGLAELRGKGYDFTVWAEADVRCDDGPNAGFLEAYAKAGGQGLFLGVESVNPANIAAAGKKQNVVAELPAFFARCREHGIAPEGGYIIGFDADTPESLAKDVQFLADAGLARAWFFIKTLLPGSQDWIEAKSANHPMSDDLNEYDSSVVSSAHEQMTDEEWFGAYQNAVKTFYSPRNMAASLCRYPDSAQRWRLIKGYLWCRWAYLVEGAHPMVAGFYRFRSIGERRPGQAPLSFGRYLAAETWRHMRYLGCFFREYYIFQQVILEAEWYHSCNSARGLPQNMRARLRQPLDWFRLTFGKQMRRDWLNAFWKRYGSQRWQLLNPLKIGWHARMLPYAIAEAVYTLRFAILFIKGLETEGSRTT